MAALMCPVVPSSRYGGLLPCSTDCSRTDSSQARCGGVKLSSDLFPSTSSSINVLPSVRSSTGKGKARIVSRLSGSPFSDSNGAGASVAGGTRSNNVRISPSDDQARISSVAAHYAAQDSHRGYEAATELEAQDGWDGELSAEGFMSGTCATSAFPVACLERSYITEAAVGRVECNSKGCRPILNSRPAVHKENGWVENGAGVPCFDPRSQGGDAKPQFSNEFSQFLDMVWTETDSAEKWFEAALSQAPHDQHLLNSYAKFVWKELGDMPKADQLFKRATAGAPDNAEGLASYALFLWQNELNN